MPIDILFINILKLIIMEKTLDLKTSEVVELGREELKKTNGGAIGILTVLGAIATVIAIGAAIDHAAEKVVEGWNNPR